MKAPYRLGIRGLVPLPGTGRARGPRAAYAALVGVLGVYGAWYPSSSALAQSADETHAPSDVRALTRLVRRNKTVVTEAQASELTLTLTEAAIRPIQIWVRTAGTLDPTNRVLSTFLRSPEAELVEVGQRARCYSVESRTQMQQAHITRVTPEASGARIEATLAAPGRGTRARYLIEIVTEQGPFLSVPNESIIEDGGARVAYVRQASGEYSARTIHTGIEGELYTQILDGLAEGDQVVSIGSFFVDADNKLKGGSAAQ